MKEKKSFIIFWTSFLIILLTKYLLTGTGIPCPIYLLTKLSCPGCGISRMFISLFKLDIYQAFRFNPLIFILLILTMLYNFIKLILNKVFKKNIELPNWIYTLLILVVIGFGILRNIPEFSYLLPTQVN